MRKRNDVYPPDPDPGPAALPATVGLDAYKKYQGPAIQSSVSEPTCLPAAATCTTVLLLLHHFFFSSSLSDLRISEQGRLE